MAKLGPAVVGFTSVIRESGGKVTLSVSSMFGGKGRGIRAGDIYVLP